MKKLLTFLVFIFLSLTVSAQPNKIWATYFGDGTEVSFGPSQILYDSSGFIYFIGSTSKDSLGTPNSFKPEKTSIMYEDFLVKFDTLGNLIWATYLGSNGVGNPTIPFMTLDPQGNILIFGTTIGAIVNSQDLMGTSGTYQPSLYSGYDGRTIQYILKFDANGQKKWGTYVHNGHNTDIVNLSIRDITCDQGGSVIVCGVINNPINYSAALMPVFPPSNAHMTTPPSLSSYNAFVMKFDSTGNLLWGTYYGGNQNDIGMYVTCDQENNIYMVGATESDTGIASPTAFYPQRNPNLNNFNNNPNHYDNFIVKFNPDGNRQWGTYTNGLNIRGGIAVNNENDFYLFGVTNKDTGIASQGTHQNMLAGDYDISITKWNKFGERLWGSYFGGEAMETSYGISPYASNYIPSTVERTHNIALDGQGNILLVGYTSSEEKIIKGCTYIPQRKDGVGFMAKFYPNGDLMWGSYYEPALFSVATNTQNSSFYTLGHTKLDSLATSGAFQETKITGASSFLISKMEGDYVCPELSVSIQNDNGLLSVDPFYQNYQWYRNGNSIAGAHYNSYQTQDTGTYWVTFENACACPYTSDTLWVDQITGVHSVNGYFNIQLFPNPNKGSFRLTGTIKSGRRVEISIADLLGKQVYHFNTNENGDQELDIQLNCGILIPGIYFLHLNDGWQQKVLKFSIEK